MEVKSSVIDLGTSANRSGVKFGIGHNYKVDGYNPSLYSDQPKSRYSGCRRNCRVVSQ